MIRGILLLVCCSPVAQAAAFAEHSPPPIEFSIEANRTECVVGMPILLKLSLRNAGSMDYEIIGELGWAQGLTILSRREGAELTPLPYRDYVRHSDVGPILTYFFTGRLAPGEVQVILHMVPTDGMSPGPLRFKAELRLRQRPHRLETAEITVNILEKPESVRPGPFTNQEEALIYKYVVRKHNRFERGVPSEVVSLLRKGILSDQAGPVSEYALYAGVFQAIGHFTTPEDVKLAEEAAEALSKRFPDSWLRAHAYALLFWAHFKKGNFEKARGFAVKGLQFPESNPLFQNLGIMEKLEKLSASSKRQQEK